MREEGLREVFVVWREGRLTTVEGAPSTPALAAHLARLEVALEPGWRTEIGLRAVDWVRDAGRRLRRGFLILIDYGHEASDLHSATHAAGTLTSFTRHTMSGPEATADRPPWLERAGGQDLTAHVDFTSVRAAAEDEGLVTLGFMDQTYFILGVLLGRGGRGQEPVSLRESLALRTLLMPGGLGSTHKVLILGKGVGRPSLLGCSFRQRVT
jgi:SAM-dependent MidA family methyltransferase